LALTGQGFCLTDCEPPTVPPETTTLSGVVVERRAGTGKVGEGAGQVGSGQAPKETPLAGVRVCLEIPRFGLPCATTGADGKFELGNIPPNRNLLIDAEAVVSFTKDGYLPTLRAFSVGEDNQTLPAQTRLFSTANAQALATSTGTSLPDENTAWVTLEFYQLNTTGATGISVFEEPGLKLRGTAGVTVATAPTLAKKALYPDATERVSATDAGAAASSEAGSAVMLDVPPGEYTFTFDHATLNCGASYLAPIPPGWVIANIGAVCGPGTQ
jgi:hypothetical protein